ncbi:MAG: DUF4150 domain-containing protein [Polyangiaceae bacterium]|nr:DUF4150 domain-containing protein [Polyangiaceae bacterium]NUQ73839.1 DUF4150 domain-containing protein [Polyangiaceae bacterium]
MHMPALSTEGGLALAIGDACEPAEAPAEAPAAVPYANVAELPGCERTSSKVLIRNRETVVITSARHATKGGRPGTTRGVVSGTAGDRALFRGASSKVYAELKRIVTLGQPSAHNGVSSNMPAGLVVVPSQKKVLIAP